MPANGRPWGLTCPRGDLNTETGEISPDRGNHAIKVTRAGLARTNILRVFAWFVPPGLCTAGAAGAGHLPAPRAAARPAGAGPAGRSAAGLRAGPCGYLP